MLLLLIPAALWADDLVLLPRPQQLTLTGGFFGGDEATDISEVIVSSLPGTYDYPLAGYPNEAYELTVTTDHENNSKP